MKRTSSSVPVPSLAALSLAGQIGCAVPAIILAAVLGGLWLDRHFGTGRWITLGLLLASLPLSIYITFRLAMRAAKEMNEILQVSGQGKTTGQGEANENDEQ